jgi:hypothetical protein
VAEKHGWYLVPWGRLHKAHGPECERIDHTWAFPLHVYLYKNYNPNHKWEITTIRTLHDLEDQVVMSHNVTYLWQSYHIT